MLTPGCGVPLPGHGLPVMGSDRVAQRGSAGTAELLRVPRREQTARDHEQRWAASTKPSTVSRSLPTSPGCRICGRSTSEPRVHRHQIWRLYGGWWHGRQPRHLEAGSRGAWPARWRPSPAGLAPWRRSPRAAQPAGADRWRDPTPRALRLAGHLAEMAWLADPSDPAIRRTPASGCSPHARRRHATSHMAKGCSTGRRALVAPQDVSRRNPGTAWQLLWPLRDARPTATFRVL